MIFVFFIVLLFAMSRFHLWEHRCYLRDIARAHQARGIEETDDWREMEKDSGKLFLKRAFMIRDKKDALRYGLPVIFFAALLLVLQSWGLALFYAALLCVKWFALTTVVLLEQDLFEIRVFGYRLLSDRIDP